MEQLSEKFFFAGAVVQLVAYAVLVAYCLRRRARRWALVGALGGALSLLIAGAYLTAVLTAELTGDFALLRMLARPWGDIVRAVLGGAGTVLIVTALVTGHSERD